MAQQEACANESDLSRSVCGGVGGVEFVRVRKVMFQ